MAYLTERQRDVLDFIRRKLDSDGVAPTLQEIADEFCFASTASAQKHVGLLEKKGFVRREKHQKRGLIVADQSPRSGVGESRLPLLGAVAAGSPIESIADPEPISVPSDLLGPGDHFVLRVRGDSMVEEGIHDGDFVIVHSTSEAADGDVVVALLEGEVTLKRMYRERDRTVRLQPANAALPPMIVAANRLQIQGVVVGLLRRY
jgi:repressor LexA